MDILDLDALRQAPLRTEPFDYVTLDGFVRPGIVGAVMADFPKIDAPGSHPLGILRFGSAFAALVRELESSATAAAFGAKFGLDLVGRPAMVTVRGHCRSADGGIHTDSETKIVSTLIYLNDEWAGAGGRLRLLRSPNRLDDFAEEIHPKAGTLVAFRRSNRSWHGHEPFDGPRRAVQLNWLTSAGVRQRELARLAASAVMKRLLAPLWASGQRRARVS